MNAVISRTKTASRVLGVLGLALLAGLASACEEPTGFGETIIQAIDWSRPGAGTEPQAQQIAAATAPGEVKGLRLNLGGEAGTIYLRLAD